MFKKFAAGTFILAFSTLTACGQSAQNFQSFQGQQPVYQQDISTLGRKKVNLKTDWYANLRPDLKEYYADARGKTGEALFDALHEITGRNYKVSDYGNAKSYMYSDADNIEMNGNNGILTAYSQVFVPGSGGNGGRYLERGDSNDDGKSGDFINCEHTWPQSFFSKQLPMVSDIHHLQSTFSVPNNKRGHFPFGEAGGGVVYTTSSGSKLAATEATQRKMSLNSLKKIFNLPYEQMDNAIRTNSLDFIFEPTNVNKGNTARAMMYFYLRYHDKRIKGGAYNEREFWDSKVAMFKKWSEQVDPVDSNEMRRNDLIQKKQGNRNPFIDIPGLASLIGEDVLTRK